jgi:hypothetical protein
MAEVSELLLGKGALRHLDMKMIVLQNIEYFPDVIQVISPTLAPLLHKCVVILSLKCCLGVSNSQFVKMIVLQNIEYFPDCAPYDCLECCWTSCHPIRHDSILIVAIVSLKCCLELLSSCHTD